MEKRFKNNNKDILVRTSSLDLGCGIVEMLHLWDGNNAGCVIGYWEKRKSEGEYIAEFHSVLSRIMETEYDNANILLEALKYGQKLADIILTSTKK